LQAGYQAAGKPWRKSDSIARGVRKVRTEALTMLFATRTLIQEGTMATLTSGAPFGIGWSTWIVIAAVLLVIAAAAALYVL
jgi:hypothetical protein